MEVAAVFAPKIRCPMRAKIKYETVTKLGEEETGNKPLSDDIQFIFPLSSLTGFWGVLDFCPL